jgi:hypothetical protein
MLEGNISPPALISSAGISSLLGDLYLSNFAIPISNSKGQNQVPNAQLYVFISEEHH